MKGDLVLKIRVADYIFDYLSLIGIKEVFYLPGGGAMHLVDALHLSSRIKGVCLPYEQACAIAAEGNGRIRQNLGVLLVTSGPGGTNAITGVAGAWYESSPMLIISGQAKRSDLCDIPELRQRGPQENDIVSMVKSITKYSYRIDDPADIPQVLSKAIECALTHRRGPVWLDIPLDVQGAIIDLDTTNAVDTIPCVSREDTLTEGMFSRILSLLQQSKRPVIIAGNGITCANGREIFRKLVDIIGIPVLTTWTTIDLLPGDHPLCFGSPGIVAPRFSNFVLQNSDLILCIGVRLDPSVIGFDPLLFAPQAKKIIVDIDEAELMKHRFKVNEKIQLDARFFMEQLLLRSEMVKIGDNIAAWIERCNQWKQKYPVGSGPCDESKVDLYRFYRLLAKSMNDDEWIVPCSSGWLLDIFFLSFLAKGNQRILHTGGLGSMGFALPASIGLASAQAGKRVVSIEGDGGFLMDMPCLQYICSEKLPIKYFVINNNGYGAIRSMQEGRFQGRLMGSDGTSGLYLANVERIAHAFAIPYKRIDNDRSVKRILQECLMDNTPVLCEVMADPKQGVMPKSVSELMPDGTILSRPIQDMWPLLDRVELSMQMMNE